LFFIFYFCLACLALQTENIVQKITQPIFDFGNFVTKMKNGMKSLLVPVACFAEQI
jgi:hypothetical protein